MKSSYKAIIIFVFIICLSRDACSQKWVNPNFDTQRLDYRDLGYPAATELEADNSPISALLTHSNGKVYGATSGKQSFLFVYDKSTNKVFPLGLIPKASGVHHSLVEGSNGLIYIGTGLNELEKIELTRDIPGGRRTIEQQLWKDIKNKYEKFDGGHILVYDPKKGDSQVYIGDDKALVTDLGLVAPKNSIYALTVNASREKIYGITYPDALFFEYDIKLNQFVDHGKWLSTIVYAGPERTWRSVPRSLLCDVTGKIVSSADSGLIKYFDPATKKMVSTSIRLPGEYRETQNYNGYPVAEQLIKSENGAIYGSTSDGYIFQINSLTENLINLGKPRVDRRVRAMTLGLDHKLYMICGEFDNVCKMYSYDLTKKEGFLDYGVLGVDKSPYYAKLGYQFDAMTTGSDGSIFIGESDRRAKLFIYIPGAAPFKGGLNATNPR